MSDYTRRKELLHVATQDVNYTLIQSVISHPQEMPALRELELLNPSLDQTTIIEHLEELISAGVVTRVEYRSPQTDSDLPSTFIRLTPSGRTILEDGGLFRASKTLKYYLTKTKKTEEHLRLERTPRPPITDNSPPEKNDCG